MFVFANNLSSNCLRPERYQQVYHCKCHTTKCCNLYLYHD